MTTRQSLLAAEARGMALFDAIEAAGIVAPGRRETEIDADIFALAARVLRRPAPWAQARGARGSNHGLPLPRAPAGAHDRARGYGLSRPGARVRGMGGRYRALLRARERSGEEAA